jgi:hypothetical protein
MSHFPMTAIRLLLATLFSILVLAACATAPQGDTAPEPEAQEISIEPWEGDGMEIPLDGSSLEAFDASVARVEAHVTEKDYKNLTNALEYLLLYDLGAQMDREKLASRLDGKTPREVLGLVKWRRPAPGKSSAEKGAADAKIIDG